MINNEIIYNNPFEALSIARNRAKEDPSFNKNIIQEIENYIKKNYKFCGSSVN